MSPLFFKLAAVTAFGETLASTLLILAQVPTPEPFWAIVRELGSFGLVAVLIWYFVRHALPQQRADYIAAEARQREAYVLAQGQQRDQYLKAQGEQRADFLTALGEMRKDFIAARGEDRSAMKEMTASVRALAEATYSHVQRAETVWQKQEAERKRGLTETASGASR